MSKSPKDDLETQLSSWADSRRSRHEQVSTLEQRIRADWAASAEAAPHAVPRVSSPGRRRCVLTWAVASAATAAAVWLAFGANRQSESDIAAVLWDEQVRQQSEVLSCCHELFGDSLAWLVESGDRSDVGLSPNASSTQAYIAVRLRLTARSKGSTEWREVQTLNVIAAGETSVELPVNYGGSTQLSLWAYPLDERVIAIDLRYQPDSVPGALIEASVAQVRGTAQTVSEFSRDGVEYRLLQTAQQIDISAPRDHTS